jgi:hypothetical protein
VLRTEQSQSHTLPMTANQHHFPAAHQHYIHAPVFLAQNLQARLYTLHQDLPCVMSCHILPSPVHLSSQAAASSVLQLGEALSLPVTAQALARQPGWAPNRMLLEGEAGEACCCSCCCCQHLRRCC